MLDDNGDAAKVRDAFGSDNPQTSDWLPIEYVGDEAVIDPNGYNIPLSQVMRLQEDDDKWIQKAVDPAHKGYCTPMTKPTCTPARKAFAKRAKAGDLEENISIDVKVGDTIMTGRFKNSPTVVKSIGKDEQGMPTINGKKVVTFKRGNAGAAPDERVNETDAFLETVRGKIKEYEGGTRSFGRQQVSQDQYDELQYDKTNMEKAMGDAFQTPPDYVMRNQVQIGDEVQTKDGDIVQVKGMEGNNISVRVIHGENTKRKYKEWGIPLDKEYFDITWSPVQFDTIVG